MPENEKNHYAERQKVLEKRYRGESETDPEFSPMYGRFDVLRNRYGADDQSWDPEFGGLDTSATEARKAAQKMRDHLAANNADPDRPTVFNVSLAGRTIRIEVRQDDGQFTCQMPVLVAGQWEWRTLIADSYDGLISSINRILAASRTFRELTATESLELGLLAAKNPTEAFARYMELRCGPESEDLLRDPRFLPIYNDGVIFVFSHTNASFPNTPEAIAHIKQFAGSRPLTIAMCKAAMKTFDAVKEQPPTPLTDADLNAASDKDLKESLRGLAHARAQLDREKHRLVYGQ